MAAGLPMISSATEDNKYFYSKHDIGLLCDTTKPQAIAAAINHLLNDTSFAASMALRNKENFIKEYNFDRQFAKIETIIAE
jgi:glycosyltransferase involved in cell wall biosynthesis